MFMGLGPVTACSNDSDFVWEFGKLPFGLFPGLGKSQKRHKIGKIKTIFDWE